MVYYTAAQMQYAMCLNLNLVTAKVQTLYPRWNDVLCYCTRFSKCYQEY